MSGSWSNPATTLIVLQASGTGFSGFFVYSPTIGTGTLVASLSAAAGTDPYGNAYSSGFTVYDGGEAVLDRIDFTNGNIQVGKLTGSHFLFDVVHSVLDVANSSGQNVIQIDAARKAIFLYSGVPALGNLAASIAQASGTDAVGNGYTSGFTTYDNANGLFTNLSGATIFQGSFSGATFDFADAAALSTSGNALFINGPTAVASALDAWLSARLIAGKKTGTTGNIAPILRLLDGSGSSVADLQMSGSAYRCDKTGTAELWQTPSYAANFTAGGFAGEAALQFRRDVQDNLVMSGAVKYTGAGLAAGANATMFTLPAGYIPLGRRVVAYNSSGNGAFCWVAVQNPGGAVVLGTAGAAVVTNAMIEFEALLPMGNLP